METYLTQSRTNCRTCNETAGNLHSLQDSVTECKTLADLLMEIAKINIKQENAETLPTQICVQCVSKLKDAYAFVEQAQRVNEQLLANLRQSCGDAAPTSRSSKQLDCLQEAPIDIPIQLDEFLQIKMEVDYSSVVESNTVKTPTHFVESIKEEVSSCSKADPITVTNPHCVIKDDNDESDEGSDSNKGNTKVTINSDSHHSGSKVQGLLRRRRRDQSPKVVQKVSGRFACNICSKTFTWKKCLERHKNKHSDEPQFECDICERKFRRNGKLRNHIRVHQTSTSSITSAKSNNSRTTRRSAANVCPHECTICLQNFSQPEKLRAHIIEVHQMKRHIQCCLCAATFRRLSELREHLMVHADGSTGINMSESQFVQVFYPQGCANQEEKVTNEITSDFLMSNLSRYYSAVDESGNELDMYDSDNEGDSAINNGQSKEEYKCELCNQTFERRKHILEHQKSDHMDAVLPHKCSECEYRYVCLALLEQHRNRNCMNDQKQFRCSRCPARFVWEQNLLQHEQLKHINSEQQVSREIGNQLQCDQCEKAFIWPKDLRRHKLVHSSENEKYECPECSRKFNRKDNMQVHLKSHSTTENNANESTTTVIKRETRRYKVEDVNRNLCLPHGCKLIKCMICGSTHSKISDLRTHLRTHQYVVSFAQRVESISEISRLLYPKESPMLEHTLTTRIIADITAQHFERFYSITNEVGYELSIDSSETDSDSGSEAESAETAQLAKRHCYECELCSAKFTRKYKLYAHQAAKHKWEDAPYFCKHCKMRFVCVELLQSHYEQQCKNTHKQFVCRKCSLRFMWKENFKMHILSMHSDVDDTKKKVDEIFQCDQCSCKYNRKDRLNGHIKKMHLGLINEQTKAGDSLLDISGNSESQIDPVTGERRKSKALVTDKKIFLCAFCGTDFTAKSSLKLHMRRHTGEKPFKCDFCDMAFHRSSGLLYHRRKHTGERPHVCTICSKAFARSDKLQTHLRVHSDERPYKCTFCEKGFKQDKDLTAHIRIHTGERPYGCGICGERFTQSSALRSHRKRRGHWEEETKPKPPTSILEGFQEF